ncbi:MAG TPA: 6-phosphogluconolactonase [Candidatus Saccharimonadales bacterium]|nr:6-phosphogluconolactonase [Candidatus Saccharimonadales bacterium]
MTRVTGSLQVFDDLEAVAAAAARIVARSIREHDHTRLALAGGSTPRRCHELLAAMPGIPWERVTIFFGDERCVPPTSAESNYRMAAETLLGRVTVAAVHRMRGELGAEAAATAYAPLVSAAPLDLVLLGIGPDGHTASLFPGNAGLAADGHVTAVHDAPKPPPDRVSLTLRALREARRVVILVAGADKKDAVRQALAGSVPAGLIPNAEWLVTKDAAA